MIGPWIFRKRWFTPPWFGHDNITIYPFIFMRDGYASVDMRHELIHVWQVQKTGWFRFYLTYLRDAMKHTYREIPAEVEAYANDKDPKYLPTQLERLVAK